MKEYSDLSEREIDIAAIAIARLLRILSDFPRPCAIEGVSMNAVELERYHDGFNACREAVIEFIAPLSFKEIEETQVVRLGPDLRTTDWKERP